MNKEFVMTIVSILFSTIAIVFIVLGIILNVENIIFKNLGVLFLFIGLFSSTSVKENKMWSNSVKIFGIIGCIAWLIQIFLQVVSK